MVHRPQGEVSGAGGRSYDNLPMRDNISLQTVDGAYMLCIPTRIFRQRYSDVGAANENTMGYKDK